MVEVLLNAGTTLIFLVYFLLLQPEVYVSVSFKDVPNRLLKAQVQ